MKDFLFAALPFVIIGVCIAIVAAGRSRADSETCATQGMCIGMCLGVALSSACGFDMGLGLSLGMLAGVAVGQQIRR